MRRSGRQEREGHAFARGKIKRITGEDKRIEYGCYNGIWSSIPVAHANSVCLSQSLKVLPYLIVLFGNLQRLKICQFPVESLLMYLYVKFHEVIYDDH